MNTIDVKDLVNEPGSMRIAHIEETVGDLKVGLVVVDQPIVGDLRLESVSDGVLVTGAVSGRAEFTCARCLRPFEDGFIVEVRELFAADPGEDDYALEEPSKLDPELMVRDAVLLAMPFSPLCRPGCKGLCPRCGGDRNVDGCTCADVEADPRWAALDGLVDN